MILLITGNFDTYDEYGIKNGTEFVVSHGINIKTGHNVVLPNEHPKDLGAKLVFIDGTTQWVLNDEL
jgi:hypothetical protein